MINSDNFRSSACSEQQKSESEVGEIRRKSADGDSGGKYYSPQHVTPSNAVSSSSSKPFPTKRKEKLRVQQQCLVKRASQSEHNDYRHCERPSLQSRNILTNYSNCAKKPSANPASLELSNYSNLIYTTAYVVSVNDSDENSKNLPSSTDYQALTSYCLTNCKESSKKGFLIGPRQQVSKSGASASRVGSLDPAINLTFSSDSQQSLRSHSFSVTFGKFQLFWFFLPKKNSFKFKIIK